MVQKACPGDALALMLRRMIYTIGLMVPFVGQACHTSSSCHGTSMNVSIGSTNLWIWYICDKLLGCIICCGGSDEWTINTEFISSDLLGVMLLSRCDLLLPRSQFIPYY
jgi:hypothetical protein